MKYVNKLLCNAQTVAFHIVFLYCGFALIELENCRIPCTTWQKHKHDHWTMITFIQTNECALLEQCLECFSGPVTVLRLTEFYS